MSRQHEILKDLEGKTIKHVDSLHEGGLIVSLGIVTETGEHIWFMPYPKIEGAYIHLEKKHERIE